METKVFNPVIKQEPAKPTPEPAAIAEPPVGPAFKVGDRVTLSGSVQERNVSRYTVVLDEPGPGGDDIKIRVSEEHLRKEA